MTSDSASDVEDHVREQGLPFDSAFHCAPTGMAIVGTDGIVRHANAALGELVGEHSDLLIGRRLRELVVDDDVEDLDETLNAVVEDLDLVCRFEVRFDHRSGNQRWGEGGVAAVTGGDGSLVGLVVQVQDITGRKHRELARDSEREELSWVATHDELTGLPNRRLLDEHLTMSLRRLRRTERRLAVLFCDLDRFKPVNDEYGHEAGDAVLVTVAHRLNAACRETDIVARFGGDEFIVVCEGLHNVMETEVVAERVLAAVAEPISLADDVIVSVGTSIGIALAKPGESAPDLLARADAAVYAAKNDPRGLVFADRSRSQPHPQPQRE